VYHGLIFVSLLFLSIALVVVRLLLVLCSFFTCLTRCNATLLVFLNTPTSTNKPHSL
jgi:hypothetical protein